MLNSDLEVGNLWTFLGQVKEIEKEFSVMLSSDPI